MNNSTINSIDWVNTITWFAVTAIALVLALVLVWLVA